jgi:hypothetical protein
MVIGFFLAPLLLGFGPTATLEISGAVCVGGALLAGGTLFRGDGRVNEQFLEAEPPLAPAGVTR